MLEIFIRTDKIFKYLVNLSKQNGIKSTILNLIQLKLHSIHGRIVVNARVKYRKKYSLVFEICIPTDKIFKYFVNSSKQNGDKSAIWNLILTTLHRIYGRIVVNAYVKYRKKIFIGVGDIHPDKSRTDGWTDGRSDRWTVGQTEGRPDGRTEPKLLSPINFFLVGDKNKLYYDRSWLVCNLFSYTVTVVYSYFCAWVAWVEYISKGDMHGIQKSVVNFTS